jgi:enamine deaminase RidA (YjgF/YER057c/UK114 family)
MGSRPCSTETTSFSAERQLRDIGISLPRPPTSLGAYVETVQTGNLLFLSGTLPVEDGVPKFFGNIAAELNIDEGRRATRLAALNALALAKEHLGSFDRVRGVVRLGVSLVTSPDFHEHPKVATRHRSCCSECSALMLPLPWDSGRPPAE